MNLTDEELDDLIKYAQGQITMCKKRLTPYEEAPPNLRMNDWESYGCSDRTRPYFEESLKKYISIESKLLEMKNGQAFVFPIITFKEMT